MNPVRFTLDDANRAADEWGANCGPGAIAGVLGLTLDEVRPHLGDFEKKRYTNPTLMYAALRSMSVKWVSTVRTRTDPRPIITWPMLGLVRVQWEGRWTEPGVPMRARYRQTHWIGAARLWPRKWSPELGDEDVGVFDINCMNSGGWVALKDWRETIVPYILRECVPKASGTWHQTHVLELVAEGHVK